MNLLRYVVLLVCLSFATNIQAAGALNYILLPGSAITPYIGDTPIGPTEPMTGNFSWVQKKTKSNIIGFDAKQLDFRSASFQITLNTNSNDLFSSVFPDSCLTYFGEIVNLTGLSIQTGDMSTFSDGCYSGPSLRPSLLNYPDVRISPLGGGAFVAKISIVAALDNDRDGIPDGTD